MLKFSDLALRRGVSVLFEAVNITIHPGKKVGLTGANGCGKSSLFALICDELSVDAGHFSKPADWQIARVRQETHLTAQTAIDYVIDGDHELRQLQSRLMLAEENQRMDDISECHMRLQEIGGYHAHSRAARLLSGLGFADADIDKPLTFFSGGWVMRLNLARALMCRSDLLLLDEPTNHLDLDAVIWLEQWLKRYKGTLVLIAHDRDFLDAVVEQIAHVEQQSIRLYKGHYSAFEQQRAEHLGQQQSAYLKQQQSIEHMQSFIDRFKAKASKAKQAQSRMKALENLQRIAPAHVDSPFYFQFKQPQSIPATLLRIDGVAAGYAGIRILEQIDFSLMPGERIGLLGLNGAGKSTLIKLLAGELEPMCGQVERAQGLKIGYFAQHQIEQLDLEANALLSLKRLDKKLSENQARTYLGGFNFKNDKVMQTIATFSGGEKARLVLALIIWQRPNLLLLDEPTNHLDLEMRLALNQALQYYEGSVILVSHDRHLLRSVSSDLWLVDRGRLQIFDGDIDAYPAWLSQRQAKKNNLPTSLKAPGSRPKVQQTKNGKQQQQEGKRLKRLEKTIEKLGEKKQYLLQKLADPNLYENANKAALDELLIQQATIQKDLQQLEDEWVALSQASESA